MKRYLILLMMVVYLAVGCVGHRLTSFKYIHAGGYSEVPLKVIPVYVDKDFGEADKVAIDDALTQWNYALNGYIRLDVVSYKFDMEPSIIGQCLSGHCWMILKVNSSNPMVGELDAAKNGKPQTYTLAWANEIGGNRMFLIRDRLPNEWVTGVSLHEMGHLLGADHDDVYLMQATFHWEDARCVDYESLKRVADYQHLPMSNLNYCVYGVDVRNQQQ